MSTQRKGIILSGGTGSRLFPSTISVSKQLMPVYDKPMIYYPLYVLMEAGIRDILIITTPHDLAAFKHLLKEGTQWGINLTYAVQEDPRGLAEALLIGEDFLDGHPCILILGDNLFFGETFSSGLIDAVGQTRGATVFGYHVKNPSSYGVVEIDDKGRALSIEEKPPNPRSNFAVTGLYFYDKHAPDYARQIKPSGRHELEITDLNRIYMERGELNVVRLGEGTTWLDTGTHKSLFEAAQFVHVLENRTGERICCPEIAAYRKDWISKDDLLALALPLKSSGYGVYLKAVADKRVNTTAAD